LTSPALYAYLEVIVIDRDRLLNTFLSLVRIDSPSGEEAALRADLERRLQALGVETHVDESGNLLGRLPGRGEPLLLSAHMDTVPGRGIQPTIVDGVVHSDGSTILGADDKSGIAVILEVLALLHGDGLSGRRPAIEIALSVGEEMGLLGAKGLDVGWFRATQALVLDAGGAINVIVHAAPASDKFGAVVHGRAAHAGSNPETGINAIAIAAQGIAAMPLGRIDHETTANVGLIQGGSAVNVVPDRVSLHGEARSHDVAKLDAQIDAMRTALETAVAAHEGARLELEIERAYPSFRLDAEAPLLRRVASTLEAMGEGAPILQAGGGGSDANILNARGIAAVPISTGMEDVHTTDESVAVADMVRCAEFVLRTLGVPALGGV
jgi:tripeptide aminopeptidase